MGFLCAHREIRVLGVQFTLDHSIEGRRALWAHIYKTLLSSYEALDSLRGELDQQYSFEDLKTVIDKRMYQYRFEGMNPSELEAIKMMGHSLGCHSFKHDILSSLSDDRLEEDFRKCEAYSSRYNTRYYSYPFGGENEVSSAVISACRKHQYAAAFLNYVPDHKEGELAIERISLDDLHDKYFIEARLCGFERFVKNILGMNG